MNKKKDNFDYDTIKQHRPNLSDSSLKTYKSIITNLYKRMHPDATIYDINFFHTHPQEVADYLVDVKPGLRKTTYSALTVYTLSYPKVTAFFQDKMMRDGKVYKDEIDEQTKSEKQRKNWITQDEVKNKYKLLERVVHPVFNSYSEGDIIPTRDLEKIQDYIIMSIYVLIPPRRLLDYTEFKTSDFIEDEDNYLKNGTFFFNKFKTAKFKKDSFKIPIKLKNLIQKWTKISGSQWLLFQSRNKEKHISTSYLNSTLHRLFGNQVSVNDLRHSFLTEYYKDMPAINEMKEMNEKMGHSLIQSLEYAKKD